MLSSEELAVNISGLTADLTNIFHNHQKYFWSGEAGDLSPVSVVNNEDWYRQMNIIDFLGSIGRHFRVGAMLGRQAVKSRNPEERNIKRFRFSFGETFVTNPCYTVGIIQIIQIVKHGIIASL